MATLVVAAALAGCGRADSTADRAARTTAVTPPSETSAAVGDADPLIDPKLLANAIPIHTTISRTPAALPELADVPYTLGRAVRFQGVTITVPVGMSVTGVQPAGDGFLTRVCESGRHPCHTDYGDRTGRLVRLAGSSTEFSANATGTLVTTVDPANRSRVLLYELPSGRRVSESPAVKPETDPLDPSPRPRGLDGNQVVYSADWEDQYRWTPGTPALVENPDYGPNKEEVISWRFHLSDEEVPFWASPYSHLVAVSEQGQGEVLSILRTPDLKVELGPRDVCRGCSIYQVYWVNKRTVVLLTTRDARRHVTIIRLDVRTGGVLTSRTIGQPLYLASNREPLT